jgi:hypothetical protein
MLRSAAEASHVDEHLRWHWRHAGRQELAPDYAHGWTEAQAAPAAE